MARPTEVVNVHYAEKAQASLKNFPDHNEKVHSRHLCSLAARRRMHTLAVPAKNSNFIRALCGRSAHRARNLCSPIPFEEIG